MENKSTPEFLKNNLYEIRQRVAQAAADSGRDAKDIAIMAVTKTVPAQTVNQVIDMGIDLLGENRVQEYLDKYPLYNKSGCEVHFIGHLQTNKVKYIVDKVNMIQSVDSLHLAGEIEKRCSDINRVMDILLEVNIGEEAGKTGVSRQSLYELASAVSDLPHLRLSGLMAIPPANCTAKEQRYYFSLMNQLFLDIQEKKYHNNNMRFLSMGMSADYELAIACGANIVRIGTALFGKRN